MNPITQILVTIGGAAILSIVASVIGQLVLSARLNQRMDDTDRANIAARQARERHDDQRHAENRETLKEIRDDVKRINGNVGRHESEIKHLRNEFNRRNGGKDAS